MYYEKYVAEVLEELHLNKRMKIRAKKTDKRS